MDRVKLTPEVESTSQIVYIIRVDGELLGHNCSLESCVSIIDSIAAREASRLSNEWTKILREDLKDGQKVILLKQDMGRLYNGTPVPIMTIDVQKVPHLNLIRHRFSEELSEIPPPPPPPSLEELSERAKEKYNVSLPGNLPECYPGGSSDSEDSEDSEESSESEDSLDYLSEDSSGESEEYSSSPEEFEEECFERY